MFTKQDDGSWYVSGTRPDKDTFTITAQTKLKGVRALRLEVLPDKRLPQGGPGRYDNGNFHLSQLRATAKPVDADAKVTVPLEFTRAIADHSDAGDVVANTLDGNPDTFWSIHPQYNQPHEAVFELKEPAGFDTETELVIQLEFACVPNLPAALTIANAEDESLRRAALAQWLIDEHNVLVWRSIVNRVWHYHFGRGLCDTPNDFGKMGGVPSHPEMLDWLAMWFRDDAKGSLKALHRLIVTSATYQQSSLVKDQSTAVALDSDNRLLWRMNRSRLTGEMVRDAVVQMSGKLDLKMGGPSVVQFKHKDVAATFMPADGSPAFLDYEHFDPDAPENYRRAVYRFVFRTVPDPLLCHSAVQNQPLDRRF